MWSTYVLRFFISILFYELIFANFTDVHWIFTRNFMVIMEKKSRFLTFLPLKSRPCGWNQRFFCMFNKKMLFFQHFLKISTFLHFLVSISRPCGWTQKYDREKQENIYLYNIVITRSLKIHFHKCIWKRFACNMFERAPNFFS